MPDQSEVARRLSLRPDPCSVPALESCIMQEAEHGKECCRFSEHAPSTLDILASASIHLKTVERSASQSETEMTSNT